MSEIQKQNIETKKELEVNNLQDLNKILN